jgi:hypothetical protein
MSGKISCYIRYMFLILNVLRGAKVSSVVMTSLLAFRFYIIQEIKGAEF